MRENTFGWLFNAEERGLLERLQHRVRIYVADPERMKTLKSLEAQGYCRTFAGDGLDHGLLIGEATPAGLAAHARAKVPRTPA